MQEDELVGQATIQTPKILMGTVIILSFRTDMPGQTVQTQIRLFAIPSASFGPITLW